MSAQSVPQFRAFSKQTLAAVRVRVGLNLETAMGIPRKGRGVIKCGANGAHVCLLSLRDIGTADCADDTDGQTLAGDCDFTGSVSNRGENGGCKFLHP
jgi:hypothetical protein